MSTFIKPTETQSPPGFSRRLGELRSGLRLIPAELLAVRTGSVYLDLGAGSGEFHLELYAQAVTGIYPELIFFSKMGEELPEFLQLLLLYYFEKADDTVPVGKFVSFADLPGGRMYAQAFQSYSGDEIVKTFGENLETFKKACEQANGQIIELAHAAYVFQALPKVSVQFVYWLGDEDFPSSCKILFDSRATHYIPIDACAIIGSAITKKIIKNFSAKKAST